MFALCPNRRLRTSSSPCSTSLLKLLDPFNQIIGDTREEGSLTFFTLALRHCNTDKTKYECLSEGSEIRNWGFIEVDKAKNTFSRTSLQDCCPTLLVSLLIWILPLYSPSLSHERLLKLDRPFKPFFHPFSHTPNPPTLPHLCHCQEDFLSFRPKKHLS